MNLNKSTLSEQIYQILRSDILTRRIQPGQKLTLKTLQERFEVSSTPIREALTRLTEEGLMLYYSNIGVRVIEMEERDVRELYEFMGDLDGLAIRYAAKNPRQDILLKELNSNIAMAKRAQAGSGGDGGTDWIGHSDRFHLIFYDYCGNSRLVRAADRLRSQMTMFASVYESVPEIQTKIEKQHEAVWESYREGCFEEAEARMKEHLLQSMEFALLWSGNKAYS